MSSQAQISDGDYTHSLEAAIWAEIAIATLFILFRLWPRPNKRATVGCDDGFLVACWLCFVADGIAIQCFASSGAARHFASLTPAEEEYATKLMFIILTIGIACTCFGEIAIGTILLRIIGDKAPCQRYAILVTVVMVVITSIVDIFLTTFRCGNPQALWNFELAVTARCLSVSSATDYNIFANTVQAFANYFYSLLSVAIVLQLRIQLWRRISLVAALGLTLMTAAASTVKSVLAALIDPLDKTWGLRLVLPWFGAEAMLLIVCGCLPVLHAVWERFISQSYQVYGSSREPENRCPPRSFLAHVGGSAKLKGSGFDQLAEEQQSFGARTCNTQAMRSRDDLELARLTGYPPQPPATIISTSTGGARWLDSLDGIQKVTEVDQQSLRAKSRDSKE